MLSNLQPLSAGREGHRGARGCGYMCGMRIIQRGSEHAWAREERRNRAGSTLSLLQTCLSLIHFNAQTLDHVLILL